MIEFGLVRAFLAERLIAHLPAGTTVYGRAIDGSAEFPAVVLGMPTLEEWGVQSCDVSRWSLPVHVVVARSGGDEAATQEDLERLWQTVLELLREAVQADQGLGDPSGVSADLASAMPGQVMVQGLQFPAYEIKLELYG